MQRQCIIYYNRQHCDAREQVLFLLADHDFHQQSVNIVNYFKTVQVIMNCASTTIIFKGHI